MQGLNPQLIFSGGAEIVVEECKDLDALLTKADIKHELVIEWGQLHIYAMGSSWIDPKVRTKTDAKMFDWIEQAIGE